MQVSWIERSTCSEEQYGEAAANFTDMSDSSDDVGLHLEASPAGKHVAHVAVRRSGPSGPQPRPSAKASAPASPSAKHRPVRRDLEVT